MGAFPVIPGFSPDPSVCRVGEDYYLATSSFEYLPGVPIFHSRDLVSWTQIGNVLTRSSQVDMAGASASGGIYAPTLRHHDGKFWLITTNLNQSAGQRIFTATDPSGPWSDPVLIDAASGIDPDLAWAPDGTCYLTFSGWSTGVMGITQCRIDPESGAVLTEPKLLWGGTGMRFPEAPHLYLRDDVWYLLIAEGGTERGHCVTIARSTSPEGPFEGCPDNPVLTHRSIEHPVQNVGHGDLVETPTGEWAMVHLGVRPRGGTPMYHLIGRETFVTGISWQAGWPRVDEDRYDVTERSESLVENFASPILDQAWVTPGRFPEEFTSLVDGGGIALHAADAEPRLLCRRVRHLDWAAEVTLDATGGLGRLVVHLDANHRYIVEATAGEVRAVSRVGRIEHTCASVKVAAGPVTLVVNALTGPSTLAAFGGVPDTIQLGIRRADGLEVLAELDGRYISTEVAGGFTGRMIGIEVASGVIHVDRFSYQGHPEGARL